MRSAVSTDFSIPFLVEKWNKFLLRSGEIVQIHKEECGFRVFFRHIAPCRSVIIIGFSRIAVVTIDNIHILDYYKLTKF